MIHRGENIQQLKDRDIKMTWTILLVCISYFVFVTPISVLNVVDPEVRYPVYHLVAFCIYWPQYSLNCILYAARSEQYRRAYVEYIKMIYTRFLWTCIIPCAKNKAGNLNQTTAFLYVDRPILLSPQAVINAYEDGNQNEICGNVPFPLPIFPLHKQGKNFTC